MEGKDREEPAAIVENRDGNGDHVVLEFLPVNGIALTGHQAQFLQQISRVGKCIGRLAGQGNGIDEPFAGGLFARLARNTLPLAVQ